MAVLLTTSADIFQWNLKELVPRKRFASICSEGIISSAISPDGNKIAVSDKGGLVVHSLNNDGHHLVQGVTDAQHVTFSHDSKLLYYSVPYGKKYSVNYYNFAERRIQYHLNLHPSEITSVSISNNSNYILSTSIAPPKVMLHNTTQSTTSALSIPTPLKHTAFHPTRPYFLAITTTGDVTCYSITSKRPSHTFQVKATTAIWNGNKVLVACEDLSVKSLDFESKTFVQEFQINAPATRLCIDEGRVFVGLKTGRCEVWSMAEDMGCKKISEAMVGRGGSAILSIGWISAANSKIRPILKGKEVDLVQEKGLSDRELPADMLDVFSPLKRKDFESDNAERKEKRMKESSNAFDKSTRANKRFSTVIDSNEKTDKTKEKHLNRSKRDDIRIKEREMDKEALKALSSRTSSKAVAQTKPLQVSTKPNLPGDIQLKSPRKSILKDTVHETISSRLQARSPSPHRQVMDDEIPIPDLAPESPVPVFRRRSPERQKADVGTIKVGSPVRSVSVLPMSPRKREEDIWTSVVEPGQIVTEVNREVESTVEQPRRNIRQVKPAIQTEKDLGREVGDGIGGSVEFGAAMVEIQSVLRRDVERLRLDMVRQFISFRSEMGQMWEGEVDRLRKENEMLRGEVENLKKEKDQRKEGGARWKMC